MPPTALHRSLDAMRTSDVLPRRVVTSRVFLALLFVTCLVHAVTLTSSPPAWQDEVQIIEYGRTLFPGSDQSYGVNWSAENRPVQSMYYVGCLIQETAYRMTGGAMIGPRISSLAGGIIAAVALRSWLLAAGISPWITLVAGCGFLWDPLIVAGYRGARVDAWCMMFMFWALGCIRRAHHARCSVLSLAFAGAFVALSGLTWASAILLVPLLLHELYASELTSAPAANERMHEFFTVRLVRSTLIVGASAAAVLLLLLLPFLGNLGNLVADLRGHVSHQVADLHHQLAANIVALFRLLLVSPWFPLIALGGIAIYGARSWYLALIAAICGVVVTRTYSHRAVYLVPYFIFGFAAVADRGCRSPVSRSLSRNPAAWLAFIVLMWGAAISLAGRTWNALNDWGRRDPAMAQRFIYELAGDSTISVLLDSWSLYYPIRSRGWRYWGPCDKRPVADRASSVDYDYVIHDESAGLHPLDGALHAAGYTRSVVRLHDVRPSILHAFSQGTPGYGPYVVYTRPNLTSRKSERDAFLHGNPSLIHKAPRRSPEDYVPRSRDRAADSSPPQTFARDRDR